MAERSSGHARGLHQAALFIAVLALCMLVFFVFSYLRPLLPKPWDSRFCLLFCKVYYTQLYDERHGDGKLAALLRQDVIREARKRSR